MEVLELEDDLLEKFTDDRLLVDRLEVVMLEDDKLLEEIAEEKLLIDDFDEDKLRDETDDWLETRLAALIAEDELIENPALDIGLELCATELLLLDAKLLAGDEPWTGSPPEVPPPQACSTNIRLAATTARNILR